MKRGKVKVKEEKPIDQLKLQLECISLCKFDWVILSEFFCECRTIFMKIRKYQIIKIFVTIFFKFYVSLLPF